MIFKIFTIANVRELCSYIAKRENFLDAIRKHSSTLIATFFYVGYLPKLPGTFGSLAALPFAWFLWQLPPTWASAIFIVVLAAGIWAASEICTRTGVKDNQTIVIDEVLGIFLATSLAPKEISYYITAFALFRVLDIWKPALIGWADRQVHGGFGVILDDLIAGATAGFILYLPSLLAS